VFILPRDHWPPLTPEIEAAIAELPGNFRSLETSAKEGLTRSVNALKRLTVPPTLVIPPIPALAFPQIKISPFPDWIYDLISAQQGDREAAARLGEMLPAPPKAHAEVLIDAILDVLCRTEDALPVYLPDGPRVVPWHDEGGKVKSITPDDRLLEEVWRWFKVEVINAANCRLKGEPYFPKVRFSQRPSEDNPFPLLEPSKPRRGRPPGPSDSRSYNEENFWPEEAAARDSLASETSGKLLSKDIAHKMGIQEWLYYFYKRTYPR
jgi:hypothetical protein